MKLATRRNNTPDGELLVLSADGTRGLPAGADWPNLLACLSNWAAAEPALRALHARVVAGEGEPVDADSLIAPLPRSWQWLDGSAFNTHGELMQIAFGSKPIESTKPLMYQGMSDRFIGPREPVVFGDAAQQIDFEGEYGVIVDAVPMGTPASRALDYVRLVVQINDWSLRALAMPEMKTGFGFIQAKPACSVAPIAVTPDELGEYWRDGRVHLPLHIHWNEKLFGQANGGEMAVGFHDLIEHAAATRDLVAGTMIGSGTVSNATWAQVGSSCISERRAIEVIQGGKPSTGYMQPGDRVRMEAKTPDGRAPFGAIDQVVRVRG